MIQLRGHWSRTLSGTSLVVALLLLLAGERASALTADDSAALTTTPDLANWFLLAASVPVLQSLLMKDYPEVSEHYLFCFRKWLS